MSQPDLLTDDSDMELWVLIPIAVVFSALYFAMRNERVRRLILCPVEDTVAEVEVVQRCEEPRKPVRVKSCSLLKDPERVTCGQACIHPTH